MHQFNSGYEIWGFFEKTPIFLSQHYFDPQIFDPRKYVS